MIYFTDKYVVSRGDEAISIIHVGIDGVYEEDLLKIARDALMRKADIRYISAINDISLVIEDLEAIDGASE